MKLNKEQICFIDNYLKNSGVKYVDVRFEMVDHVASALTEIEGDFYDNLKSYMLVNKKELLQSNLLFRKRATKSALMMLIKSMLKPFSIALVTGFFAFFYFIIHFVPSLEVGTFYYVLESIMSGFFYWTFFYYFFSEKEKFSVTDKILVSFFVLNYFILPNYSTLKDIINPDFLIFYYSLLLSFSIIVCLSYRKTINNYKSRYKLA
ncbi:MAG: hypothetical protein ACI7YS_06745 [Flavobacterium sp.]